MTTPSPVANIDDYKRQLFDLYKGFRYNELICDRLRHEAMRLEKWVRSSVVITLAISLLTGGGVSFLNKPALAPWWALVTALATILSIYSLITGSGARQFFWFSLSVKFHSGADEVEFFSEAVKRGTKTEDELHEDWQRFRKRLSDLIEQSGIDLKEYDSNNKESLEEELKAILHRENKAA